MARTFRTRYHGLKEGYRSGLEASIARQIETMTGSPARYESKESVVSYLKPQRIAKYTPDFVLPNGIIVETKGRFVTADRQKHLLIKEQHPLLDIRFVFNNPSTRISKLSQTTYAMWCEKHGFLYAKLAIPAAWFKEKRK